MSESVNRSLGWKIVKCDALTFWGWDRAKEKENLKEEIFIYSLIHLKKNLARESYHVYQTVQ